MYQRILPLLLAAVLLFSACGREEAQTDQDLYIEIKAASHESLEVTWHNNTQYEVLYGDAFFLEYLEDGQWVKIEPYENTGFHSIGYMLQPNSKAAKTYSLPWIYDVSRYGTYRLKVSCRLYDNAHGTEQLLHAEFQLPSPDSPVYKEPPKLTLDSGDSLELSYASSNWSYVDDNGNMAVSLADAPHPLQMEDLEFLHCFSSVDVRLEFEFWPAEFTVRCWKTEKQGNLEANSEAVMTWNNGLQLKSGDYIYEVTATWKDDGAGYYGTATYVFRAEAVYPEPLVRPIPS